MKGSARFGLLWGRCKFSYQHG